MNDIKQRLHPKYYAIPSIIQAAKNNDEGVANALNITVSDLHNKINGYDDFSYEEGMRLSDILGKSMDAIFLT